MTIFSFKAQAISYTALWKQFETARNNDLPQDMEKVLNQIIAKAEPAKDYGQFLKAQLTLINVRSEVSPDSLSVDIQRLKDKREASKDIPMNALWDCILSKYYGALPEGDANAAVYAKRALEHPDVLAKTTTNSYEPAIVSEYESRIFNNDLLHVVGLTVDNVKLLHDFYVKQGNRPASCITALLLLKKEAKPQEEMKHSAYIIKLDSLINEYSDLRECGELAIERYNCMEGASDCCQKERYDYINYAVARWGEWPRMNILRNAQAQLTLPSFSIKIPALVLPNRKFTFYIENLVNLHQVDITITRVNVDGETKLDPENEEDLKALRKLADHTPAFHITRNFYGHPIYEVVSDTIEAAGLRPGMYLVEATADANNVKSNALLLHVSDVFVMHQPLPDNNHRLVVVSATTGQPLSDSHINLYNQEKKLVQISTDNKGEANWRSEKKNNWGLHAFPFTDDDHFSENLYIYNNFSYSDYDRARVETNIFTDRSIYRPGQTVHVAVMVSNHSNHIVNQAIGGKTITIKLRDANWQTLKETKVTTDEYGTAQTDFVLPQSGLTGNYAIQAENRTQYIKVEEYKRPTFEVKFDKLTSGYKAGDTVSLTGHVRTFAGMPVMGANVKYTVNRSLAWWRWWGNSERNKLITTDSCTTDDKGDFTVRVPLILPDEANSRKPSPYNMYSFNVTADVTSGAGETQQGSTSVPVGKKETIFTVNLPNRVRKDELKTINFGLVNAAGEPVSRKVLYHVEGIEKTFTAMTNETVNLESPLTSLKSGKYKLVANCGLDTLSQEFIVFDISDKHPACETKGWFWASADEFPRDGSPVYVQVGSSDENVHFCYTFISGKTVLEKGSFDMSNFVKTYKLNYEKEYGDNLELNFAWVKDGVCYTQRYQISKPLPDKSLNMKWTTFRDKVKPGDEETWTLNISRPAKGKDIFYDEQHKQDVPTGLQLMAVLYDKSLDVFSPHKWEMNLSLNRSNEYSEWNGSQINSMNIFGEQNYKQLTENPLSFSHIDENLWNYFHYTRLMNFSVQGNVVAKGYSRPMMAKAKMARSADAVMVAEENGVVPESAEPLGEAAEEPQQQPQSSQPSIRENLNETAFFYPTLLADEKGDVKLTFRLPESVTTWKFMGLAHDKNMNHGMLEGETVAQKSLMVQPNMPRFIREGDAAQLSATVTNTTDMTMSGEARLEIIEPETEKVVFSQNRRFTLGTKDEPAAVVTFDVPSLQPNLYVARVIAETKNGSDGEQHYLPVLTNREYVTNTVAFTQTGTGTKSLDLKKLADGTADLTVEYTNNPAWLMVQTLNNVSETYDKDAISLVTAYYANRLGQWIMQSNPNIKNTVNLWEQNQEQNLTSPLKQNSELKNLQLNDTPWMQEANSETEQMRSLSEFFNENALNNRLSNYMSKLEKLQKADGSFSWWPGMDGSPYMTVTVAVTLARLQDITGDNEGNALREKAYDFLQKEIAKEVVELKKEAKKGAKDLRPSETACNFLYLSAITNKKATSDINYLVSLLAKQPTALTIYGKSMGAIILDYYNHKEEAQTYLKSVDQYTVYKEDMGRYFDTPKAQYTWRDYKIPSQVAAIEAFQRLNYEVENRVPDMQRWLLQEKRTQLWDTPVNTADAVYAFLYNNKVESLTTKTPSVLKVNGETIATDAPTAGLGYVKTRINQIAPKTFTAEKTSDGTSWGAVYAQFWLKSTDVKAAASGMTVKRELLSADGKPVSSQLKVGDKVKVRITITADRDYDFVQVQDKRAACMEPVSQLSGYHWGYYLAPKDNVTNYYFNMMSKGTHVVETEYYIDRAGTYQSGTCTAQCAYSPAFSARAEAITIYVK
jgi:hypothetical protein